MVVGLVTGLVAGAGGGAAIAFLVAAARTSARVAAERARHAEALGSARAEACSLQAALDHERGAAEERRASAEEVRHLKQPLVAFSGKMNARIGTLKAFLRNHMYRHWRVNRMTSKARRVLIHMNNTNPVLDEESPASAAVRDAGWEVAYDGMEFQL